MLVSVKKAAEELGVCTAHIHKKIKRGEWPAYRLGRKATRIDLDEIKRLMRSESAAPAPTPTDQQPAA